MRNGILALLYAIVFNINGCCSVRILGLFPLPIKSHFIVYEKYIKELVNRGHEVYVVSHFPRSKPIPNYHDISINGSLPNAVAKISMQTKINRGAIGKVKYVYRTCGSDICEYLFKHHAIVNLKYTNVTFDLVISEIYGTDCLTGFAYYFKTPLIGISSTDLLPWAASRMGNPDNPSHIPNYFLATNEKMDIQEKLQVLMLLFLTKIGYFFLSTAPSEMRTREFFGYDIPSLDSIVTNTSLILVNSHLSVNIPRPMVPGIVEIGGLHIEEANPVPQHIEKILRSSKESVIYFSMGTVINMETFPKEILQDMFDIFGKIPCNIIYAGKLTDITIYENIYVIDWVPQLDLLCDERLKLFITHGGLLSIQEAAYCGVPILGIPVFPDLERNANRYVYNGGGLTIPYEDFTIEAFKTALTDLLTNTTYKKNAEKISEIFKDRPISPMDAAIYWTEYVITFGGSRQLKTKSSELIWFEYYLVDCILVLILMVAGFFGSICLITIFMKKYVDDAWFYKLAKRTKNDIEDITKNEDNEQSAENVKENQKGKNKESNKDK